MSTYRSKERQEGESEERLTSEAGERLKGIFINVQGFQSEEQGWCEKLMYIIEQLEGEYDFAIVAETWYKQWQAYHSSPFFVAESVRKPGRASGGVAVFAKEAVRRQISVIEKGENWVKFGTPEWRIAGLYSPPPSSADHLEATLVEIGDVEYLMGDINVNLGSRIEGGKGGGSPRDKVQVVEDWMGRTDMQVASPSLSTTNIDHIFHRSHLKTSYFTIPFTALPFQTDHPILLAILHPPVPLLDKKDAGLTRFRLGQLDNPIVAQEFRHHFQILAPVLEQFGELSWAHCRAAESKDAMQEVVDAFNDAITEAISTAAEGTLGTYRASETRSLRDSAAEILRTSDNAIDAMRLWRRSRRGTAPRVVSVDPSRTPEEEVSETWRTIFGADEKAHEEPIFEGVEFVENGGELGGLMNKEKVEAAVRRYGKHKSAGGDSIHARLIAELCYKQEEKKHRPRHRPRGAPPPPPPPPQLIPTQPARSSLSPTAEVFTPKKPEDDEKFPLLDLISSLFQLCVATRTVPKAWGFAIVTMLSKLRGADAGNPTAADLRPISLLPMFRRLFETLLLPHFTSAKAGHWASLHPHQAGFRQGWSTISAALAVDHTVRHQHAHAVHLDLVKAYDMPKPAVIIEALRRKKMPEATLQLVWSLLTTGATMSLVVNGVLLPAFARTYGFPQGGPLSPQLFNLFIDELLERLNKEQEKGQGFFFADDGTLVASTADFLQKLVSIAEQWASEVGMRWSIPKSIYIPPSTASPPPSAPSPTLPPTSPPSASPQLYQVPIPSHTQTKHLGFVRTADGIQFDEYISRVTNSPAGVLRGLQAAGSGWRPSTRRLLWQIHGASVSTYGGALALTWARAASGEERKRRVALLKELSDVSASAVRWITGMGGERGTKIATALTAIPDTESRLEQLTFGLALHAHNLSLYNPVHSLIASPSLPNTSNDLLVRIRDNSIYKRYQAEVAKAVRNGEDPPSPQSFRRTLMREYLADKKKVGDLGVVIMPTHRTQSLVDNSLQTSNKADWQMLRQWRAGVFLFKKICFSCGKPVKRGCDTHMLLRSPLQNRNNDGPLPIDELEDVMKNYKNACKGRPKLRVLDYLVGHPDWNDVAIATLREWKRRADAIGNGSLKVKLVRAADLLKITLHRK